MVVEDFASAFLAQRGLSYWLIVYGLIVAGGLVGWMWSALTGRRARLGQAPFFVRLCLATLFLCVAEMASFKSPEAMAWMVETRLAAWLVASSLIGGVYIGRIAAARCPRSHRSRQPGSAVTASITPFPAMRTSISSRKISPPCSADLC